MCLLAPNVFLINNTLFQMDSVHRALRLFIRVERCKFMKINRVGHRPKAVSKTFPIMLTKAASSQVRYISTRRRFLCQVQATKLDQRNQ